jgi:glycosyltransferase involved in cell wall biosynthesis
MKDNVIGISREKCFVLPQGVDTNIFFPINIIKSIKKINYPIKGKIIIFFPSDYAWVKDYKLAKKVFNLVKLKLSNTYFINVNNIKPSMMNYVYNAADVLLLTSKHEGSNNSIKEAMCCNLPVVSVNVGDSFERLRFVNNSYVSKSRDPHELSNLVVKVLISNERSNGTKFLKKISLEECALQTKKIYKSIIHD